MKCITTLSMCASLFALSAASSHSQQSTLSIPLAIPAPAPLTVTIPPNTTVTQNGITYLVTGTLTLTQQTAPSTTGTTTGGTTSGTTTGGGSTGGTPPGTLTFTGYRDANRNPVTSIASGSPLLILGSGFGNNSAGVTIGGIAAPVLAWSDTSISVTVPSFATPQAAAVVVNGTPDPYPLTVTVQTNLLPGSAPGDLPQHDWPPFVADIQDTLGVHVETVTPGEGLRLVGNTFGDMGGTLWVGNEQVPTTAWADGQISLTLPADLAPSPTASVWTLQRSGGGIATHFGPIVLPKAG